MEIELNYTDWKANVDSKDLAHFSYIKDNHYYLIAIDGALIFKHKLDIDDNADYETKYLAEANKKLGSFYSREPFATKILKDGSKLFRRKHGQKISIPTGEEREVVFSCPYDKAKINKLEIIKANPLDRVDLYVKSPADPAIAALYGLPADLLLNQFGFDVSVAELLYSDKSDYDAELLKGFQTIVKYKNDGPSDVEVGFNLTFHEVVAP